jgi:hypothetical protein
MTWGNWGANKRRCPSCAKTGFQPHLPAVLYYVRFFPSPGECFYKIGITNKTVRKRFEKETLYYEVLREWHYPVGADAEKEEQKILRQFSHLRNKTRPWLQAGNTETFREDILGIAESADWATQGASQLNPLCLLPAK